MFRRSSTSRVAARSALFAPRSTTSNRLNVSRRLMSTAGGASAAGAFTRSRAAFAFASSAVLGASLYYGLNGSWETHAEQKKWPTPQPTVVSPGNNTGAMVVIRLKPGVDKNAVARAAAKLPEIVSEISPEDDEDKAKGEGAVAAVGFSAEFWSAICANSRGKLEAPAEIRTAVFRTKRGNLGEIPATGGDIFLHVKSQTRSLAYEVIKAFVHNLGDAVQSVDDRYGWQFQEGRDLTGFIDGTENPAEFDARMDAGVIKTGKNQGGSYVMHQRWHHDLIGFSKLNDEEQNHVFGRERMDSKKLHKDVIRNTSHVQRMVIRDTKGKKTNIVRQSMPFGRVGGDHGLLFIAYADSPKKFEVMLDRMVGKDGVADETMRYSRCVTSQYFYVPAPHELNLLNA